MINFIMKKKVKHPKSIKEIDLSALKPDAEAIKYLITNLDNGMMYSGSHKLYEKGVFPDTYWQSSRNSEFNEIFYGMKPILKYEIIESGNYPEIKNLERDTHKKEDVINNPKYYNLANAGGSYHESVRAELCKHIVQRIKDGHFNVDEPERVDALNKLKKLQVRLEVPPVDEIANKMREQGDASNSERILIWEDEEEDMIGDGNRTLAAAIKAKILLVRTDRIPSEVKKEYGITEDEMKRIGQLKNPVQTLKEPTDEETIIETILGYNKDNNTPINCPSNKTYITDIGYSIQKANSLIKKAEERKSVNDLNAVGKTCITYAKNDDNIVEEINKLEDEDTIVSTGSSGSPTRLFVDTVDLMMEKPNWTTLIVKPYHNLESNRRSWEGDYVKNKKTGKMEFKEGFKQTFHKRLSHITPKFNDDGIPRTIVMDSMPHFQSKITKTS